MKIADSKQKCNPEQISLQLQSIVDKLKANVQTAAADGESFDSVDTAEQMKKDCPRVACRLAAFMSAWRG